MTAPRPLPQGFWIERVYDRIENRWEAWAQRQGPGVRGEFVRFVMSPPALVMFLLALFGPMFVLGHLGEYLVAAHGISRKAAGAIMMLGGLGISMMLILTFAIRRIARLAARGKLPQ